MKKTLLIILMISVILGCRSKADFLVLSEKIYRLERGSKKYHSIKTGLNQKKVRKLVFNANKSSFLHKTIHDTLFIIQGLNTEAKVQFGQIWGRNNELIYEYDGGQLKFTKQTILDKYQMRLIKAWDTSMLKQQAKEHRGIEIRTIFNAMRCFKKNEKWYIDTVYFNDFFDPKNLEQRIITQ